MCNVSVKKVKYKKGTDSDEEKHKEHPARTKRFGYKS
jgi:hypothetical protein